MPTPKGATATIRKTSDTTTAARPRLDSVALQTLLDERMAEARVSQNDLSFNELLDMYRSKELIITPEFQRTFRWSLEQRSRFIESLLLELPIPPIFVVELETGEYELVDGLQRISTYIHFRGLLPSKWANRDKDRVLARSEDDLYAMAEDEAGFAHALPEDIDTEATDSSMLPPETPQNFLELQGCEIVPELNGLTFRDLPISAQIAIKRYFVRVFTVRRVSRKDLKYHMFKRLNQGGSKLSDQELRNCFIRIVGQDFIRFVNRCSRYQPFWNCIRSISDNAAEQLYHQELALRFFAYKNDSDNFVHDIGPFLDQYLESVSQVGGRSLTFDYEAEKENFENTFTLLHSALGVDTFRAVNPKTGNLVGFRSLLFEAIPQGIQEVVPSLQVNNAQHIGRLKKALEEVKKDPAFIQMTTGGGKNSKAALKNRIDFVRTAMRTEFHDLLTASAPKVGVKKAGRKGGGGS